MRSVRTGITLPTNCSGLGDRAFLGSRIRVPFPPGPRRKTVGTPDLMETLEASGRRTLEVPTPGACHFFRTLRALAGDRLW